MEGNETHIHRKLLEIARQSLEAILQGKSIPDFQIEDPELLHHHGAFVTLKRHNCLRGCMGRFVAEMPLYQLVIEMAVAAALEDPRFQTNHVRSQELNDVDIEVSVVSPLKRIANPLNFELGRHGIYVKKGSHDGCFLPQVAQETGWSKEEFLSQCCTGKAGLSPDAWKEPDTEVYIFEVDIVR
ncbi:MAG: AmmeMemoRadiSam system protein A [Candidatus Brocadiales bacterium]